MLFIVTQQAKLSLILSNAEIKLKKIADKKRVEQMFIENYLITRFFVKHFDKTFYLTQ